jgi:stage II sporulation protein D
MQVAWSPTTKSDSKFLVDGKPVYEALIEGQLRLTSDDGKVETGSGRWMITAATDGLHVLLTIPSERYVAAVLMSEAAPGDRPESLKALAVVARSFALTNPQRHEAEGLCDSTHCQAMRMGAVPDAIAQAVRATAGETLWSGGRQVAGYFTQNCGGQSADAAELWGGPKQPWLVAHADPYCQRQPSAWHASVEEKQLRDALAYEGWHLADPVNAVRITKTDSSGRVARIAFPQQDRALEIHSADLRFAINRALGWNTIRSDWYRVREDGHMVVFDGKGYGHGVGLCQAGAAEMARQGKSYRQILAFYFPGAKVRVTDADEGWKQADGRGWTLRSVDASPTVLAAGDTAWARARAAWPGASPQPMVTLTPDTELFRQMTGEPGWALASASGNTITLQPPAVIQRHGKLEDLMLHEFLHALVEHDASVTAPLWLREGVVEMLAGEPGIPTSQTPAQLDAALVHASTLEQASQAHRAACGLVRRLVAKDGMDAVRSWLRSGVPAGVVASQ